MNMTRPDDPPANFTIHFDLKLKNENVAVGLHYPGPITITFSYFPNVSMMVPLAEYKLDSFYQGNGKTKHVRDFVETNIFPTVLEGTDMIAFRVDVVATYRISMKSGSDRRLLMSLTLDIESQLILKGAKMVESWSFSGSATPCVVVKSCPSRELENGLVQEGIQYYIDPLYFNLSFVPKDQNTIIHLAEFGLHGFYQGNGKAKRIRGLLSTRGLPPVNGTSNGTQSLPAGAFRVDFFGKVRYKLVGYHKRHPMTLAATVEVDDKTGVKVGDKAIRMVNSGAWDHKQAMFLPVSILLGTLFI
ncbi:hypothetical protein Tco_1360839 [Tanacetum coccineum]